MGIKRNLIVLDLVPIPTPLRTEHHENQPVPVFIYLLNFFNGTDYE